MGSTNQALAILPDKQQLAEVNNRIKVMLPGGAKLSNEERFALAQIAVAHGLDPFNGEVWYIPGRGPMIGIKGLRKKARESVTGNYWIDFREITDAEERKRLGINARALAYEARLFDSDNVRTYCDMISVMTKAGVPWPDVKQIMGDKPYTSGIGFAVPESPDQNCQICKGSGVTKNKWGKDENCKCWEESKMSRPQRAMKRAEADAIKRRFDVPFGLTVEPDNDEPVSGEWKIEGASVESQDADPAVAFRAKCGEMDATETEVNQALDDAGGDYETAVQYLTKRVAARKLQNGKKAMGRDDSGL